MSSTIAILEPEAAEEFRHVFNEVVKYVGVNDVKVKLIYCTGDHDKRRFGNDNCWKDEAQYVRASVVGAKSNRVRRLSDREYDLVVKAIDIAYNAPSIEAADVGLWNDNYTTVG